MRSLPAHRVGAPLPGPRPRVDPVDRHTRRIIAEPGSLADGAIWLLGSNLLYAASQWATLMALAKLGTPVGLGYFGLALAVATPVTMLTGFGLRAQQATDVQRRYAFADYLHLRLLGNLAAALIVAGVVAVGGLEPAAISVLVPIALAKLIEATSETCYGLAQRHHLMRLVAVSKVVRGTLGLAALVLVVGVGGTLAAGAWAMAASWGVFLVGFDLRRARRLEPVTLRIDRTAVARLARESVALSGVDGVFGVTQAVPRYLLQMGHGAAAVGYFTALAAIVPAIEQLAGSIGHAAAPRLGWSAAEDGRGYLRLVGRLFALGAAISVALTLGAALGGRLFLRLAYTPDYVVYLPAFIVIMLSAGFALINSMSYFAVVALRRPGLLMFTQSLGLLATGVVGWVLIPGLSVVGAAISVCAGRAIVAAVTAAVLLRGGQRP